MKTLASHALIAKRKSGNITGGGINDTITIAALNTMNDSAQLIVDQAVNETDTLRNLLDGRSANLQACQGDLVDPDDEANLEFFESAHDACRQEETDLYVAYRTQKHAYEAAINSSQPPNCTKNWISTPTCPGPDSASTFYEIENSDERMRLSCTCIARVCFRNNMK